MDTKGLHNRFKIILTGVSSNKLLFWGLTALIGITGCLYAIDEDHTNSFWAWIDPVAGIMTFITTLVIFCMQAYKAWEDKLEKQLYIDYYYVNEEMQDVHVASIMGAYLAGESDIRQWAISLGGQMFGTIKFDMNWNDELPPSVIRHGNKYFKKYIIRMYLTELPVKCTLPSSENLKFSKVEGDLQNLPIRWVRK